MIGRTHSLDMSRPPSLLKRIGTTLVLASFLTLMLFSFSAMMHESENSMQGDCPFSATGVAVCPQNAFSAAIHHISAYQSLLGISGSLDTTAFIVALLLALYAALSFSIRPPLLKLVAVRGFSAASPPTSRSEKITNWLSLFENSPSPI